MRRRRQARMWRQVSHDMKKAAQRVEQVSHSLTSDGSVEPGVSRTGRVVLRCAQCGKVCYNTREDAEKAAVKIPDPMVAYLGPNCGWWHLSTDRRNARTVSD